MKFSETSFSLLKNLANVAKSVYLVKGKRQYSYSPDSTVICGVELDEEIPCDVGVYDLWAVLNFLKSCEEPDIEFTERTITATDLKTGMQARWGASSKELINTVDTMDMIYEAEVQLAFDLPSDVLRRMIDLAASNKLPQIAFIDSPSGIIMKAFQKEVTDGNCITVPITRAPNSDVDHMKTPFIVSAVNMKIEVDSYRVMITKAGFARLVSSTAKMREYVIVTETGE